MERDPLGLSWRSAPLPHLALAAILVLLLPVGWAALELVRTLLDDVIDGRAFETAATVPFLRLALPLPERIAAAPLVLFPGVPLDSVSYGRAAAGAAIALVLLAGMLVLLVQRAAAFVAGRALARLREAVVGAVSTARPAAAEEAERAATLVADATRDAARFLGGAILDPMVAGTGLGLALVFLAATDWRLAVAAGAGLLGVLAAWPRRFEAARSASEARRSEAHDLRQGLEDLVRRLPALRAHGTAALERSRMLREGRRPGLARRGAARRRAAAVALAAAAALLPVALVTATGAILATEDRLGAGDVAAAAIAGALATAAAARLLRWGRALASTRGLFDEIARSLGALQARNRKVQGEPLSGAGALVAENLSAYEPASGTRMPVLDLAIPFPAHVALTGEAASGPRVFAALLGGQLDPSTGRLAFGGVDLADVEPAERARRIAYAGGETVLVPGSLRDNLTYGCADPALAEAEARIVEAAAVVGLDRLIHARGLSGTIDPAREPKLAAAIVESRRAIRATLAARGQADAIEPFDPDRYNRNATIGENILFGVALGDTFREANLPGHPFMRAILEAEGLTKPLVAMGQSIASSMIEIFADIPDGHPLFDRFSFFSAAERGYFEDLVARRAEGRRGAESNRDRERLVGLALRYSESRHRLGLLDEAIEARLVTARGAFSKLLPTSLAPAIEFYDPTRLCAAASLLDNLLFGRVAQERAGAEEEVLTVVRAVLRDRGLDQEVVRIGLDTRVDARDATLLPTEEAAIDVARCLVRGADIVVVERALDGLPTAEADAFVSRLRRALVGRGLVLVAPELTAAMEEPPFDRVLRFERGGVVIAEHRRQALPEPVPA